MGEYLRHRTRSNKVKARCTLFHVITYAIQVEQTLTHVTRISLPARNTYNTKPVNSSILHVRACMHGWFIYVKYAALSL